MIKKNKETTIEITPSSGNVFADLELPEPQEYLAKANLAKQINRVIQTLELTQSEAAVRLGVDQPKISAISRGQLSGFSLERLISYLNKLDHDVEISVTPKPSRRKDHGRFTVALAG